QDPGIRVHCTKGPIDRHRRLARSCARQRELTARAIEMQREMNMPRRTLLVVGLTLMLPVPVFAQGVGDIDRRFASLKDSFLATSKSFGDAAISTWTIPSAYVSKRFIARSLSVGVANAGITVAVSQPGHPFAAPFAKVTTASIDPIPCNA